MKRDIILVLFGGTMDGVFGAGVVNALQKANLYPRIHSIYGTSCGAHNAAYFLAENTSLGARIYYEDLIGKNFIKDNKFIFLRKLSSHLFHSRKKIPKLIDIDYLIEIEKSKKKLDIGKISKSKINFYIRAFDVKRMQEKYLNGNTGIFKKLQASSAIMPFYPKVVNINGKPYADGQVLSRIIDPFLGKVLSKTNKKIIFIFNMPVKNYLSPKYLFANAIWTLLLALEIKDRRVIKKLNIFSEYLKLRKYLKKPNIYLINSDIRISPFCTDKEKLLELYNHGIDKTNEFLAKNRLTLK